MMSFLRNSGFYLGFICIAMSACTSETNDSFEIIDGKYNIGWIGEKANRSLCYHPEGKKGGLEIIKPYVASFAQNEQFIVAKQHPLDCIGGNCAPDTAVAYFFIIRKNMIEFNRKNDMWGPLTQERFKTAIENLHVGEIKWPGRGA